MNAAWIIVGLFFLVALVVGYIYWSNKTADRYERWYDLGFRDGYKHAMEELDDRLGVNYHPTDGYKVDQVAECTCSSRC